MISDLFKPRLHGIALKSIKVGMKKSDIDLCLISWVLVIIVDQLYHTSNPKID